MKKLLLMSAMLLMAAAVVVRHRPAAQILYVPKAQLCADGSTALCSKLPAYIGRRSAIEGPGPWLCGTLQSISNRARE